LPAPRDGSGGEYRYALDDAGFAVVASTGGDAIRRARELRPDLIVLIVLDERLPDMPGWNVCAVLEADARPRISRCADR
jgi:CheY-like chemotaxis protein